ncbi:hypothetical protein A3Q56_02411 [Intoshia linei]|uniref:Uncharacterized protein n=1 Tax=Intoshia linei TaxID=1819745 RepID=A0A177B693_9BILA|nr:hypothetical protein A3Q56_02411 [Intoshia linei]
MSDSEKPILETIKIEKPEVNVGELKKKLKLSRDEMKLMNKKVTHYRRRTLCPTLTDFEKYNMLKKHTGRNTITYKENIKLQNLGNSIDNPFLHNGKGQKISVRSCQADIAYKEEPISNCSITPLENLNKYLKIINNFKCQNRSLRLTNAHVDKDSNFSNSEMSAFSSGTQKGKNMNTSDFQITKHLTLSDNNINYKDNLSIPLRHNATMYNINQKNYRRSKSLQESFSTQSLHVHRNSKTISPWFKIINKLTKGIKKRPSTINIDKIKKTSIHRSCDSSISINDVYNNLTSDYRKKMMKWEKKNNREKHLFKS